MCVFALEHKYIDDDKVARSKWNALLIYDPSRIGPVGTFQLTGKFSTDACKWCENKHQHVVVVQLVLFLLLLLLFVRLCPTRLSINLRWFYNSNTCLVADVNKFSTRGNSRKKTKSFSSFAFFRVTQKCCEFSKSTRSALDRAEARPFGANPLAGLTWASAASRRRTPMRSTMGERKARQTWRPQWTLWMDATTCESTKQRSRYQWMWNAFILWVTSAVKCCVCVWNNCCFSLSEFFIHNFASDANFSQLFK